MAKPGYDGSNSRPGVLEMTEMTTKNVCDGVLTTVQGVTESVVATVSYAEPQNSTSQQRRCDELKTVEYIYIGIMVAAVLTIVMTVTLVFVFRDSDEVIVLPRETIAPLIPTIPATPWDTPRPMYSQPTMSTSPSDVPTKSPAPSSIPTVSPSSTPTLSVSPSTKPSENPTMAPTVSTAPSSVPSSAPTIFLEPFLLSAPDYTIQSIQVGNTPQSLAYAWLRTYPEKFDLPRWRVTQQFALATFFFALKGPDWPEPVQHEWLQNDDECLWNADIDVENAIVGETIQLANLAPCNGEDRIQAIELIGMNLAPDKPAFPKEIDFLSDLKSFALISSDVYAPLADIVPQQFYNLNQLEELALAENLFLEKIPTFVGMLTNLKRLYLQKNRLTGSIPTELGLLTSLEVLDLSDNSMTGWLPVALTSLTSLKVLDVANNFLSGRIPDKFKVLQTNHSLTYLGLEGNYFSD